MFRSYLQRITALCLVLVLVFAGNNHVAQGRLATRFLNAAPGVAGDVISSGLRSLHYEASVGFGTLPRPGFITADGSTLFVSFPLSGTVGLYQIDGDTPNLIRNFGIGPGAGPGQFNGAEMVAVSGDAVFIADFDNHRIQKFDKATGTYISSFGIFGAGGGQLDRPVGVILNPVNGFLYVSEYSNNRISVFNASGLFQFSFGSAGSGNGQLSNPQGLAVDGLGNVYAADYGNMRIAKFNVAGAWQRNIALPTGEFPVGVAVDRAGLVWTAVYPANNVYAFDGQGNLRARYEASGPPNTRGFFSALEGIAVTPPLPFAPYNGNPVIIASNNDSFGPKVELFTMSTQPTAHPQIDQLFGLGSRVGGVAFDSAENIYITLLDLNEVWKYDKFGRILGVWGSSGTGDGQFDFPYGITIDDSDNVYVADSENSRIQKFTSNGIFITQWGSFGERDGEFKLPVGLACDGQYIYVTDDTNHRVQRFTFSGLYVSRWGAFGTRDGLFNRPVGIAVDRKRLLVYVAEAGGNRIQVFNELGEFVMVAVASTNGPGQLSRPVGLTTDQKGNMYVADGGNNRVVQFSDQGKYLAHFSSTNAFSIGSNPKNHQIYVGSDAGGLFTHYGVPIGKSDTLGVWRPSNQTFYLRNTNTQGFATFSSAISGALYTDLPVVGDWNGDGIDTPGLYRPATALFSAWDSWVNPVVAAPHYQVLLGNPGDTPLAGDWNGDGSDAFGVFRPSNGILYLKNDRTTGFADYFMILGNPSDKGVTGDWNRDGDHNAGVYRPSEARFYLSDRNAAGIVYGDHKVYLGAVGDTPFTGQWTGEGHTGLGVFRPTNGFLYLKYQLTNGFADVGIFYGAPGDVGLGGVWGPTPTAPDGAPTKPIKPPNVLVAGPITAGSTPVNTVDGPEDKFD